MRVRIAFGRGLELEFEGPPPLLEKYESVIQTLLDNLVTLSASPQAIEEDAGSTAPTAAPSGDQAAGTLAHEVRDFGELLHRLPKGATAVDQILLAAWHVEKTKGGQPFSTAEANRLLIEHGIRVANASQSITNNVRSKRIFKSGGGFRVSREGQDVVKQYLGLQGG